MSKPLSLRFVLQRYFPYGGQQRDFLKIATEAVRRGHRVQVLVERWEGEIPAGIEVITVAVRGRSNHARQADFAKAVQHYRHQHPVDCQIGFIRMPGLDVYFAADPCYRLKASQKYGRWLQWLPRIKALLALEAGVFGAGANTQILALTEQSIMDYQASYQTPAQHFHLLPPAVTDKFQAIAPAQREACRQHYGLQATDRLLLMVGSHFKTKGVDRAIVALTSLPATLRAHCKLWIAGTGDSRAMMQQATEAGVHDAVHFLGGRDDIAGLMQAADLLLQPSRTELAGMSIVEAIASGLPVLASGECGYSYHVQRAGAGVVLPTPFAPEQLSAALIDALQNDRLQQWRAAAMDYAKNTDLRGMAAAAIEIIEAHASAR